MRETCRPKTWVVNGFEIGCDVEHTTDGGYHVVFFTVPQGSADPELRRVWPAPIRQGFKTEDEAKRYARYVSLGISNVSPSGKPVFSVV